MSKYKIHVQSFLRTDILGTEFELPYSDELNDAVLLINKLCGEEVIRLKEEEELRLRIQNDTD